jgi:excisionase family DNA binding protein
MAMFEQYPDVVTVRQLCEMLKIGRNTAYGLVQSGVIESIRVKGQIRITKASVIKFLS